MKTLLKTALIAIFLAFLYIFASYSSTPAYATTYNCVWTFHGFSYGTCAPNSSACTPSPDPCQSHYASETNCKAETYTCPGSIPSPTCYAQCRAGGNTHSECSALPSCDEPPPPGSSPSCYEQCMAEPNNTHSECSALPSCDEPVGGGTTNGDEKTKFNLWDLIKRKEEIDLGFIKISTDPEKLAADILELGIGVGALLAVLFTIIGGFGVATSSGDPDKLEKAKSQITAAVSGLVFLLASALILKYVLGTIIGVDFF